MSYTVAPYLVDLARLQAVYGSRDAGLLATLERENAGRLRRDEATVPVWVMRLGQPPRQEMEGPPVLTLRQALRDLIAGTITHPEQGWQYIYAAEALCAHLGTRLANDHVEALSGHGIGVIAEIGRLRDLNEGPRIPLPVPLPVSFPTITYITAEEATAQLSQGDVVDLPGEDQQWVRDVQQQYRSWLQAATQANKAVIAFLY